jgi:sulfopyruvate decarboxylase subunit beta
MAERERDPEFTRRTAAEVLARVRTDEPVITSPGLSGSWLARARHLPQTLYQMELPYTTPMCLGIALAMPHQRVIALEGDGALICGLAGLTTVARYHPPNLVVLVMDNGDYGTTGTGEFATASGTGSDLAGVARAAGIASVAVAWSADELEAALRHALATAGPHVVLAKVTSADRNEASAFAEATTHLAETAVEFRQALRQLAR